MLCFWAALRLEKGGVWAVDCGIARLQGHRETGGVDPTANAHPSVSHKAECSRMSKRVLFTLVRALHAVKRGCTRTGLTLDCALTHAVRRVHCGLASTVTLCALV